MTRKEEPAESRKDNPEHNLESIPFGSSETPVFYRFSFVRLVRNAGTVLQQLKQYIRWTSVKPLD